MAREGSAPEAGLEQFLAFLCGDVLQAVDRAPEDVRHAFGTQVQATAESSSSAKAAPAAAGEQSAAR